MLLSRAKTSFSSYLVVSFCCPPKATTVRIADRTSSAMEPAEPYASNSFFANFEVS